MADTHRRGLAMAAAGMLVISPDGLLLRLIDGAGPWDVVFWRTSLMSFALLAFQAVRYRGRVLAVWRGIGLHGVLSGLLIGSANVLFVLAMLNTTVADTLVIVASLPLMAAVAGWVLIKERVRRRTWLAIAVAFMGILVIFQGSFGAGSLTGNIYAAVCALLMGLNLVLLRHAGDRDMSPALALGGVFAAVAVLPAASPLAVGAADMAVLALLGLGVLPLSLGLFLGGTRYVAAAEVGLLALIETILGPFWAWLGVGETPSWQTGLGGAVVLGSIVANVLPALRRGSGEERGKGAPPPH